jgi:hypothetical protein
VGDDLTEILKREILSKFEEQPGITFLKLFAWALALCLFISGLLMPVYIQQIIRDGQIQELYESSLAANMSIEDLKMEDKMDLILRLVDPSNELFSVGGITRFFAFILGCFLAAFSLGISDVSKDSLIVITKKDKQNLDQQEAGVSPFFLKVSGFVLAIVASVLANYVYYYMNL